MLMGVIMYHIILYISFYFPHQFTDGIAGQTLTLQERQQQEEEESHFKLVVDLADILGRQRMVLLRLTASSCGSYLALRVWWPCQ